MRHSIKKRDNVAKSRPGSNTDDGVMNSLLLFAFIEPMKQLNTGDHSQMFDSHTAWNMPLPVIC